MAAPRPSRSHPPTFPAAGEAAHVNAPPCTSPGSNPLPPAPELVPPGSGMQLPLGVQTYPAPHSVPPGVHGPQTPPLQMRSPQSAGLVQVPPPTSTQYPSGPHISSGGQSASVMQGSGMKHSPATQIPSPGH